MGAFLSRSGSVEAGDGDEERFHSGESDGGTEEHLAGPVHRDRSFGARRLRERARIRYYAVWHVRGGLVEVRGVHGGDIAAWEFIERSIPGGRYRSGTDRLRRYPSLSEAIDAFYLEAQRHGAPLPANYRQH